ncbi:amidase [Plastoroseomonas arctica]|uniref:Amidase n=1 Tax=Plastoroseomonas arctica TaxID=1509237 RepID=A0AAF1KJT3_9PROT|nr:amidase [Plastoroseomonas arctica]
MTPAVLLDEALTRIARANDALGAFVHVDVEGAARAAAEAGARQAAGARRGPLDGVPVAVKDNLWVAGMPAHWGSRTWADFVPPCDDIPVERLRASGAVILGKTNTPEFALSRRTDSRLRGPARNPWDVSLTPGGSSGGSVTAVAAGMVPLALTTDAGGSTRLPASYTGLYGLRPSNGRIARRYGFPPIGIDFQAVGCCP